MLLSNYGEKSTGADYNTFAEKADSVWMVWIETYNDLDGEVVNFFRVLRDQTEQLIEAIGLTPFSREEFALACQLDPTLSPLERARRFYVRARQVRTGLAQTASLGRWANCKQTSRRGMSGVISRWLGGVDLLPDIAEQLLPPAPGWSQRENVNVELLPDIAERLLRVQIENRPALDVLELYDSADTLFYCDPPYLHDTRGDAKAYQYEMTDKDHAQLAEALNSVKGLVAFSNYESPLFDTL